MAEYTLHIPPAEPLSKNDGISRFQRAQIAKQWRHTTFQCAQTVRLPKGLAKVRIDVALRFAKNRARDEANYHDTAKPIVDALGPEIKYWRTRGGRRELVYAPGYGLIANDTPEFLDGPYVTIGEVLPKKSVYGPTCRVTVTITDLSGEVGALMPWFMTDDKFHSHKKVILAAKDGVGPLGLWLIAGSWCADQLTDGFIPDYMAARLDPLGWEGHAADLVRAGLWLESKQGDDAGWQFHQWDERQPTRAEVEAKRAEARDRMSKVRAAKKDRSHDVRANETRTSDEQDANFARSSDEVRSTPALPSPTQPGSKEPSIGANKSRQTKTATQIDPNFWMDESMIEWGQKNTPSVNGTRETEKFVNYWISKSGKDATKKDWVRTWRNWMLNAQDRLEANAARRGEDLTRHVETTDERCAKHPRQLADFCSICDSETRGAQ